MSKRKKRLQWDAEVSRYLRRGTRLAFTFVVSCYGPIGEAPRIGIENLKIAQVSPDGKCEEAWFSQSDPWAREEELESLLEKAPDLYDGFVLGAMTTARLEGIVSETCDFILANPGATTSDNLGVPALAFHAPVHRGGTGAGPALRLESPYGEHAASCLMTLLL